MSDLSASQATSKERCPDCGAATGGRAGCQTLFNALTAQALSDGRYAAVQSLAFDAYCMQHLDTYCRSAKSYAAHLTRLCCGLEYDGSPAIYAAIQKWLNGRVEIRKPGQLIDRGRMTVADVRVARTAEEHQQRVRVWAEDVWKAYASQHDLARLWLKVALGG